MPERQDRPGFQQAQYRFAANIRDPQRNAAPTDVEDRRMQIYRDLFYNNVEGFLANAFPVIRKLSTDAVWHARVRDFFARHKSRTPEFHGLSEEFLKFLQQERGEHPDDPPYLVELAHYEWVELALGLSAADLTPELGGADTVSCNRDGEREAPHRRLASPESDSMSLSGSQTPPAPTSLRSGTVSRVDPNGDLLAAPPVVSPLAWPLAYAFPVHRINPEYQPAEAPEQPTYLVVYRTRQDEVKFMEINAVSGRLLQLIEENPEATGHALLLCIAEELGQADPAPVLAAGRDMLLGLRERDILLGTRHV